MIKATKGIKKKKFGVKFFHLNEIPNSYFIRKCDICEIWRERMRLKILAIFKTRIRRMRRTWRTQWIWRIWRIRRARWIRPTRRIQRIWRIRILTRI